MYTNQPALLSQARHTIGGERPSCWGARDAAGADRREAILQPRTGRAHAIRRGPLPDQDVRRHHPPPALHHPLTCRAPAAADAAPCATHVACCHSDELRADMTAKATMAGTMGRGIDATRDYMRAKEDLRQVGLVQREEAEWRVKDEQARQREEKKNLSKAFKIEKERFEEEWARRIAQVEADCAEKERVLREVHEVARADMEKEIQIKMRAMRPRASSTLLQHEVRRTAPLLPPPGHGSLRRVSRRCARGRASLARSLMPRGSWPRVARPQDTEKKLSKGQAYGDAAEVAARAHRMRALETVAYERERQQAGTAPRAQCITAQETELRNLQQKCHSMRVVVRREREQALEVFKQKYRNLEADLEHAHKIEYSLRPEIGPIQTQKSRSTNSSTFRGTLKFESLAGTKFDVAEVSCLPPIEDP